MTLTAESFRRRLFLRGLTAFLLLGLALEPLGCTDEGSVEHSHHGVAGSGGGAGTAGGAAGGAGSSAGQTGDSNCHGEGAGGTCRGAPTICCPSGAGGLGGIVCMVSTYTIDHTFTFARTDAQDKAGWDSCANGGSCTSLCSQALGPYGVDGTLWSLETCNRVGSPSDGGASDGGPDMSDAGADASVETPSLSILVSGTGKCP